MPVQPLQAATLLAGRHVALSDRALTIFAGVELGVPVEEIATRVGVPAPSVRRQIATTSALLFDPLPLQPNRQCLGRWTRDHFPCCAKACVELVSADPPWRSRLEAIQAACHPGLSRRRLQILTAHELGYPLAEIGEGLCLAPSTVNGHLGALERDIFRDVALIPDRATLGKWTHEHLGCCTQGCVYLFQNNLIFDRGDRPVGPPRD